MVVAEPDKGWAWVVVIATCGCFVVNGVAYSLGVYVAELIIEQDLDRPTVALFGSLQIAMVYVSAPMSYVSELTSHRLVLFVSSVVATVSTVASIYIKSMTVLYFTFGVIPGLCLGVMGLQSSIVMNRYVNKWSGFANCFVTAGSAAGTLIYPPLFRANIDWFGWRSSLYIVAGIFLQGCVFSACLRPVERHPVIESKPENSPERGVSHKCNVYRKPSFYLLIFSLFLWCFCWPVVFVFGPTLFFENGMTGGRVDILMSVIGTGNLISRLGLGFVFRATKLNVLLAHVLTIVCLIVALILFVAIPCIASFVVASVLFGISFGSTNCTQSLAARHVGEVTQFNVVYSWSYVACVFGSVFSPFLCGYIYNATLSYTIPFLSCAGVALLSAAVMAVAVVVDRKLPTGCHHRERFTPKPEMEVFL